MFFTEKDKKQIQEQFAAIHQKHAESVVEERKYFFSHLTELKKEVNNLSEVVNELSTTLGRLIKAVDTINKRHKPVGKPAKLKKKANK